MRTGSEDIAPSSAARWEIDLSAGARIEPESPREGSKRILVPAPGAADELLDDEGIEDGVAAADALDAGTELIEVGDALLEQVADAVRAF